MGDERIGHVGNTVQRVLQGEKVSADGPTRHSHAQLVTLCVKLHVSGFGMNTMS